VVGIDREPKWIAEAIRVAQREAQGHRFGYQQGIAEELPFDDASFDLVTCQTLLIHVREPRRVIREMLRVLEPGGLLLAAEPNNRGPLLVQSSANADAPIDELLDLVKFELTCERGKAALGEGDNSLGDLLPGLLAEQGAVSIQTFLSDKTAALFPPYDSEEQQALRAHLFEQAQRHDWGWSREEARRYFLAGDGSSREFDASWQRRLEENDKAAATVLEGKYHSAGATILYLVAGRRPPDATESKHRSAGCSIYPR
jgi:SAM-dependent methyltransferase